MKRDIDCFCFKKVIRDYFVTFLCRRGLYVFSWSMTLIIINNTCIVLLTLILINVALGIFHFTFHYNTKFYYIFLTCDIV